MKAETERWIETARFLFGVLIQQRYSGEMGSTLLDDDALDVDNWSQKQMDDTFKPLASLALSAANVFECVATDVRSCDEPCYPSVPKE